MLLTCVVLLTVLAYGVERMYVSHFRGNSSINWLRQQVFSSLGVACTVRDGKIMHYRILGKVGFAKASDVHELEAAAARKVRNHAFKVCGWFGALALVIFIA